jgi:inorganic phosphate transporter, PiT family
MLEPGAAGLVLVVVLGIVFDFINGFHDTANAVATSVATRVLSPGRAVLMAGVLNFLGALSGTAVATTVGTGIVAPAAATQDVVVAALCAAIVWNLVTWSAGIPSSSSHALVFSLVGAAVAAAGWEAVLWPGVEKVLQGLVLSPVLGFLGAFALMVLLLRLFARALPVAVTAVFGRLQLVSAAWMAFAHGSNDAQKTMGIITMALAAYPPTAAYFNLSGSAWSVPPGVIVVAATAMGAGTAIGGWRVIRTVGLRVVQLRPIHGFAAESAAAAVIEVATRLGVPISTTHTISTAIMGVGATRRLSAVRWGIAGRIVVAWGVTLPVCFALAWTLETLLRSAAAALRG